MKKYKVRVEISGKVVLFKNTKIRTPFEIELADNDIKLFEFAMNSSGISDYKLEEIQEKDDNDTWEEIIAVKDKEVVIEDLYIEEEEEPNTILEKLLRDERNGE